MAIAAKPHDHGLAAEINVTPMVDVMLVLLIIFMVVTVTVPFTATLPAARHAAPAREDRVTLAVDAAGRYWIQDVPDPGPIAPAALPGRLAAAYAARGDADDHVLYLKADHGASYATVMNAVDAARRLGVRRLGMITEGEVRD
jgi:biopolymer transport protein ExbD